LNCRLLYLVGQLGPGGLERQLYYLLKAMDRERFKPAVVVWNYSSEDTYVAPIRALDVPLYFMPKGSQGFAKLFLFRNLMNGLNPDLIHSYTFYTNFAAWWAATGTRVIPVGSMRLDFVTERRLAGLLLGKLSALRPSRQICNSNAARIAAEQSGGIFKPRHVWVVRNGLDLDLFRPHPLPETGPSILAVGRLYPQKRWDRLLRIIAETARRGKRFSVRLAGDGPLLGALKTQARELGIESIVQFLGLQSDIPSLLKDATLLVHTADAEGCPNAVMEAMACGRPVVATSVGEVPFLVDDGKTGFMASPEDETLLASRLTCLLESPGLCRTMGEEGRCKAEREFGLDRLVRNTLCAYRAQGWRG